MKKVVFISMLVLITIIIFGLSINQYFFSPPLHRSKWIDRWLNDPVCSPPCWNNIIPGETHISEITRMLENDPDVSPINIYKSDSMHNFQYTFADWNIGKDTITGMGNITSYNNSPIVQFISLTEGGEVTINEVIETFGLPGYVGSGSDRGGCYVTYFYPEIGMSLKAQLNHVWRDITPTKDDKIFEFTFFAIEDRVEKTMQMITPLYHTRTYTKWNGFGNQFSCK